MAKVLVFGAGVIGSIYALRFAKAGHEVDLAARGERLEILRAEGLRIRNVMLTGDLESANAAILERVPEGRAYDLAIVAVRSGQVESALREVAKAGSTGPVAVIGNNLGDLGAQAAMVGPERFVPGFGTYGGYRDGAEIAYVDGRSPRKPARRSPTTLGVLSPVARPALASARALFESAGLPAVESPDIRAWLVCHAALVFPLAGAIYASGGGQERVIRTRDALTLGVRAAKELFGALRALGTRLEPPRLGKLLRMPEWLLVGTMRKAFAGEGARVAMFGHANAPGGRGELGGQAAILDSIVRNSGRPLPAWDRLLPHLSGRAEPIPDGSRSLRLRFW
ncbi:MAG: ketopantoate reductase family protein [Spirochaetales bacterium]|nr:ketopantoate reductase family protein [Spirochaetales bacterium]